MAIKVYFHICAIGQVKEVVQELINALHMSGLYDIIDGGIYCCLTGDKELCPIVRKMIKESGRKFKIAKYVPDDESFERLTLNYMRKNIKSNDTALYIHSKGVTKTGDEYKNVQSWTRLMLHNLVQKHLKCIELLDKNDVVGCNLHN